jgi:hypothetical protein
VEVAGATAAGADREVTRELGVGRGGEGGGLFVPHVHPLDLGVFADRVGEAVQRVARHAVDAPHAVRSKVVDEILRHCSHARSFRLPNAPILPPAVEWETAGVSWGAARGC